MDWKTRVTPMETVRLDALPPSVPPESPEEPPPVPVSVLPGDRLAWQLGLAVVFCLAVVGFRAADTGAARPVSAALTEAVTASVTPLPGGLTYVGNWISDTAAAVFAPAAEPLVFVQPVSGRVCSAYDADLEGLVGYRAEDGKVASAAAGKVFYVGRNQSYGSYIRVIHEGGYETVYAGVRPAVSPGDAVEAGQTLGLCDTGSVVSFGLIYLGEYVDPARVYG